MGVQSDSKPDVLLDSEGAVFRHIDGTSGTRYIEMFLLVRDPDTGNLAAACYNSMFAGGGIPASRDVAPQALVEGIDFERLKTELDLLGASLNGPKIWTPDWIEAQVGAQRDFNGIAAPWVAQLDMKKAGPVAEVTPYEPMTIARESRLGWNKGATVMVLDDAEGNAWVLKGFQLGLEPRFTYEDFLVNGHTYFQNLPAGWKFRVTTLDDDLIETPEHGVATIMSDEFFNVYDRSGPGQMNRRA
ncbi:MAG: hypothetical protein WBX17_11740 [Microbacterium sp.]